MSRSIFIAFIVNIFLILLFGQLNAQIVENGKLKIKLNEGREAYIKQLNFKEGTNRLMSQNQELDHILSRFDIKKIERLFPHAGKFEERHREHGLHLWYTVEIGEPDSAITVNCIRAFKDCDFVSFSEPFVKYELNDASEAPASTLADNIPANFPNDPLFSDQWHYENTGQTGGTPGADISLLDAWGIERGSDDVIVAIIDGGLDPNHEDLSDAMWINEAEQNGSEGVDDDNNGYIDDIYGYNFVNNSGDIIPHYHGVHVGGTIGAVNNNNTGVAGIAGGTNSGDGVRLMSCQMFTDNSSGGAANTFVYAADNGAVIAQNSWGYTLEGYKEQAVLDAIDYFIENAGYDENGNPVGPMQGGIVIFAAGNDNADGLFYPGYYEPVMAVASTDHNDIKSYFSNYGSWVDIAAPGSNVLSTYPNNSYNTISGTSMACPHVSGVAALLVSQFPGISPDSVRIRLASTTDNIDAENPGYIGKLGSGRLNAFEAIKEPDTIPPAAIFDLQTKEIFFNKVEITWTAPGASDTIGSAYKYDIRISEDPITDVNFDQADSVPQSYMPGNYGDVQSFTIDGLASQNTYYVAVKSIDAYNNASNISNVIAFDTPLPPEMEVYPSEFYDTLYSGDQKVNQLIVKNVGESPLEISVDKEFISQPSEVGVNSLNENRYNFEGGKINTLKTEQGELQLGYNYPSENITLKDLSNTNIGVYAGLSSNYTQYFEDVSSRGAEVFYYSNMDQSLLDSLDIVFIDDNISSYNSSELEILKDWVKAGGNIFIQSDQSESAVNQITVEAGITAITGSGDYDLTDIQSHKSTVGVDTISSYSTLNFLEVTGNANYIAKSEDGDIIVAASILGSGKLMVCGNEISSNNSYLLSDNRRYSQQVIDWFTQGNDWITIETQAATISGSDSLAIDFTLDAKNLRSGDYEANININSNDPENELFQIPEYLNVINVPGIVLDRDSVNFGQEFTNVIKYDSVMISNDGVDTLFISNIESDNSNFDVHNVADTIYPHNDHYLKISFQPTAATSYQGNISIASNDPSEPLLNIKVLGEGMLSPELVVSPDSIYSTLTSGEEDQKIITIDNSSGGSELIVNLLTQKRTIEDSIQSVIQSVVERTKVSTQPFTRTTKSQLSGKAVTLNYNGAGDVYFHKSAEEVKDTGVDVLVLAADDPNLAADVVDKLLATNSFSSVTWIDAGAVTPTLSELKAFDAVLVYSNYDYHQRDSLGNNLADYFDEGGNVVSAIFEVADCCGYKLGGRWEAEEYFVVERGATETGSSSLGNILKPTHPVVSEVDTFSGGPLSFRPHQVSLTSGGELIAQWDDGKPLIVSKKIEGRERIELGFFPPSSDVVSDFWDASTDGAKMLENALLYNVSTVSWLSLSNKSDTIPAGTSADISATFTTNGLYAGEYDAYVQIKANDPSNPLIQIPAHLKVLGAPEIALDTNIIHFDTAYVGYETSNKIRILNIGSKVLSIDSIYTGGDKFNVSSYDTIIPPGSNGEVNVEFQSDSEGTFTDNLHIISNDTINPHLTATLSCTSSYPPALSFKNDTMVVYIPSDSKAFAYLDVQNTGGSNLHYEIVQPQVENDTMGHNNSGGSDKSVDENAGSGYIWLDSDQSDGPEYDWIDITSTGTPIYLSDDDYESINLEFNFPFYGENKSAVNITSNGFLTFKTSRAWSYSNTTLPDSVAPNDLIAAFWDDLFPSGEPIYYLSEDDRFIVTYPDISGGLTFQIILYKNGDIKFQYEDISGSDYTVGIENANGTEGLEISYNEAFLKDQLAVLITKQNTSLIYEIDPVTGIIPKDGEGAIQFGINTKYLGPNTEAYEDIVFETNIPDDTSVTHVMKVNVISKPEFLNAPDVGLTVNENETLSYDFDVKDEVLNSNLSFIVKNEVENVTVDSSGMFVFSPDYEQSGNYYFDLIVSDGPNADTAQFSVEVQDVNRAPQIIEEIDDMELVVDDTTYQFDLTNKYDDPDGDDVVLSANSSNPNSVSAFIQEKVLNIYPKSEDLVLITVELNDGKGGEKQMNFKVESVIKNSKPEMVTPFDDVVLEAEREQYNTNLADHFDDEDGDNLTYEIVNEALEDLPTTLSGTVLNINPLKAGEYEILVKVSDGRDQIESTMHIIVTPTNDPPEQIADFEDVIMNINDTEHMMDIYDYFEDPEDDPLSFEWEVVPSDVIIASSNDNILIISTKGVGDAVIELSVTDGNNESVSGEINVMVNTVTRLDDDVDKFSLYPNPAETYLYVEGFEGGEHDNYSVIDATGKVIDIQLLQVNTRLYFIDIRNVPEGMYLLRIPDGSTFHNLPFIVE